MKFEDLKDDSFVTWIAERTYKSWNTFGKVIKLTEDDVVILTYDDLKETTLSKNGEAVKYEIELITKDEFDDMVKIKISKLNTRKIEIETDFKNENEIINNIIDVLNKTI